METHAATDDQHTFIAQRRQCLAGRQVRFRIEITTQRQLHHGNFGIGEHQFQRYKHAMIEPTLAILAAGQPRRRA